MKQVFAKAIVLLTVILMDILSGAEMDLFVPSFPELQNQFNLSIFKVEALISVNLLGFCLSLFFVGRLADRYGRKPIILLGLIIFIIGSLFCLYATSYNSLLTGRFIQGLGIAAPSILCFLIIADSYALKQQQYLLAMLNGLLNVIVAIAPIIGSYIAMYYHWQGSFMALLILGLVVLIMTIVFISNNKILVQNETITTDGYWSILQSKPLMLMIIHMVFLFSPYWIFLAMSPILYMESLGVSLQYYGYYQGLWALVYSLGSVYTGLIINHYDHKKMLYCATMICTFGLIMIVWITYTNCTDPLLIILALVPFNIGSIIPAMIIYPMSLNFMPQIKGRVAAVILASRLILTALCVQLAGYYYQGSFQNIGIILTVTISIAVITLFFVSKNFKSIKPTVGKSF